MAILAARAFFIIIYMLGYWSRSDTFPWGPGDQSLVVCVRLRCQHPQPWVCWLSAACFILKVVFTSSWKYPWYAQLRWYHFRQEAAVLILECLESPISPFVLSRSWPQIFPSYLAISQSYYLWHQFGIMLFSCILSMEEFMNLFKSYASSVSLWLIHENSSEITAT